MCTGECNTYQTSFIRVNGMNIGNKQCKCCSADRTHIEIVAMICDNTFISAEYVRIDSCACSVCDSVNNGDGGFTNDFNV